MELVAMYLGNPPTCDRCGERDAKLCVTLLDEQRSLCEYCAISLMEKGLRRWNEQTAELVKK